MSKTKINLTCFWSLAIISLFFLNECGNVADPVYQTIRNHADQIKVIDAHEHQRWTEELPATKFRFYQLLASSYL
ncbi:MAG: hypothetical protein JXB49_25465, partial [Bacteroidales bacterium]|nr:hypothetical protein [Bacteroidales bacterium]